ncbi:unnamed protein product [Clavelina lepadiformis]|uniref:DUF7495 domain-containing protein n=1 Tax=Clavelina lepadiformis TaxID=159417 RepID=A0ABP0F1L6_CLALP
MILAGRFVRCLGVIVLLMSMARSDAADVSTCYQILQVSNHGGILIGDDISEAICFVQANCVLITSITVIRSPGLPDATWEITYGGCMPAAQCGELDCKALLSKSLQYTPFEVEIKNCTSSCCQEDLCNENNLDNEEEEITDWEDGNVNENQTMVPENIEEMTKAGQNVTEAHTIAPITAAEEIIPPDSSAPFCYQRTRIVDSNGIALIKEKERPCFPGWSCYMGIADLESVSGVNVGQLLYDGCISPLACQSNDCDVILGGRGLGFNNGMRAVNCSITCCQGDLCNIDDDDEEDEDEEITDDAAVRHYMLDDATMTYDTARQHCIDRGRDLCSKSDICVNDEPILIGIQNGDQWTPVRDGYNDWVEVGNDNFPNRRGRVCYRHNEHYSAPPWGITAGICPPWNTQKTCDLKGHVFCCRSASLSTINTEITTTVIPTTITSNGAVQHFILDDATMTYDTARQYCINNGADLCLKSDICVNDEPVIIGIQDGDQWTPVRDGYNDWVEVGKDNHRNGRGRVCYRHNEHYSSPPWGTTSGTCPPWNTQKTCDLKGHVFCCRTTAHSTHKIEKQNNDNGKDNAIIQHYTLEDATMTYDTARQYCINNGRDLCLKSDICVNNEPIIIGIQNGDQWTPVRDGYNDWVEVGNDNFPNKKGRVCYRHNEHYSAPPWGITAGVCPPWNTQKTCDLKGHVFCCRGGSVHHYFLDDATMTYDTARQHCIDNQADLCLKSDICINNEPILIGIQDGDQWTPVRDGYNDWVEIGNDNFPNQKGRVCYRHNEHYSAPSWGITAGSCPPWNTQKTCDLKSHVFCCRVPVIQHYTLDDATMTYDTARQHCIDNEADLCLKSDICVNNEPILIGIQNGDRWTPVRDGYNDWVEVGNDNNPNGRGRVCYRHNEHYSAPPWGITAGSCPPWNTQKTCDLKGHVFCCRSISSGKK